MSHHHRRELEITDSDSGTADRDDESKDKSAYEKTRMAEIEAIKAEIDRVKNGITPEFEWNVVNANIPEIWPGLEFVVFVALYVHEPAHVMIRELPKDDEVWSTNYLIDCLNLTSLMYTTKFSLFKYMSIPVSIVCTNTKPKL